MKDFVISRKIRTIPVSVFRSIFKHIPIRGRFRVGKLLSQACLPKGKVALTHAQGDLAIFDLRNDHEISMYFDFFAPDLSKVIAKYLSDGDVFVDCGANIGYYSFLAASRVGIEGKVVTIDANPYCIERITESKELGNYKNVFTVSCALGEKNGDITFNLASDPMYSSLTDLNQTDFAKIDSKISVPMLALDHVYDLQKIDRRIKLLKLDVEGAELDVLLGAENTINAKSLDYLYLELHRQQIEIRGQNPTDVLSIIEGRGFELEEQLGASAFLFRSK